MALATGSKLSRRDAFRVAGPAAAGLGLTQWLPAGAASSAFSQGAMLSPDEALERLMEGNQRWVMGAPVHPDQSVDRRALLASGQQPFAVVFSCVDSRVPPELVFDQGLGNVFVIRTAAHVIDNAALGSIEYGVEEFHIPLIVVMGHQSCGAVVATVEVVEQNGQAPGQIDALVRGIRPAVEEAHHMDGDVVDNAVRANTAMTVAALKASQPILAEHVAHGDLKIVGARYDLDTGIVDIIA